MKLGDILDVVGVACITVFAAAIWWPAGLLVIGVAALVVSWDRSRV